MMATDVSLSDFAFGMNFFGRNFFYVDTYTEYTFTEPKFVSYMLTRPNNDDVLMQIRHDKKVYDIPNTVHTPSFYRNVSVSFDDTLLDVEDLDGSTGGLFGHIQRTYGNDFRLDIEEIFDWLRDNEWNADYNGIDLSEVY